MKILVVNGPNLNLVGIDDPSLMGKNGYKHLCELVKTKAEIEHVKIDCYQSNREGKIIDVIQRAYLEEHVDGIILNPGAYAYYSYAIYDTIRMIDIPVVEVHIKALGEGGFPSNSVTGRACIRVIDGKGEFGYIEAIQVIADYIRKKEEKNKTGK